VAFAEQHVAPECWMLASHDLKSEDVIAMRGKLEALLAEVSDGKPYSLKTLYWQEGDTGQAPRDGTLIRLVHPSDPARARESLLQFGLRAYLESSRFLTSPDQHRHLEAIDVHGDAKNLGEISHAMQDALSQAAGAVQQEKTEQVSRPSTMRYFDVDTVSCGITLPKEDIEPLRVGWFYIMIRDEQAIRDWLKQETGRITGNWIHFQNAIGNWFKEEMRSRNTTGPGLIEQKPPDSLRTAFESGVRELAVQADRWIHGDDLDEAVENLITEEHTRLCQAMQRRPTRLLFFAPFLLFIAFAALFTGPMAALVATPTGSSWLWPGLSMLATAIAGVLVLLFVQWRKRVAIDKSVEALKSLQDKTASDAAGFRESKISLIRQLLLQRNLEIAESEIAERKQRALLLDFHLKQLNRHHNALHHERKWTLDEGTDDSFLPDLNLPPEQNTLYHWAGTHAADSMVVIGGHERPLAPIDDKGRYAGISRIEFHAARQQ
jgi:hypothetical protein